MHRYSLLIVDGKLAIQWDDETREQAAERARGERTLSSRAPMPRREVRNSRVRQPPREPEMGANVFRRFRTHHDSLG
jgi:hypothetical protein